MTDFMNLNFIELFTVLQFFRPTMIRNSSYGKLRQQYQTMHKQQKGYLNRFCFQFLILDSRKFRSQFCCWPSMALKIIHCGPSAKKVVHLCYRVYERQSHGPVLLEVDPLQWSDTGDNTGSIACGDKAALALCNKYALVR